MKRFRTQPSEFYKMDKEERLEIYRREWKLVKREAKEAEELNNK